MFESDDQERSELVGEGLEAILSGEMTLEAFLAQHPEQPAWLRLELETALWLVSQKETVAPRPGFLPASRKRLVARIQAEARSNGARRSIFGFLWPQRPAVQWAAGLLALILIFTSTGGLVNLSQSALPGEALYGVKQASEAVAYTLAANDLDRVEISAGFSQRRLEEAEALVEQQAYQLVPQTLQSYESQVNQTVTLLEETATQQETEKRVVAVEVRKNLEAHAARLDRLEEKAPDTVRAKVKNAEEKARMGAIRVADEGGEPILPTASPQPTDTQTATPTGTRTPTLIFPTDTLEPLPFDTITLTPGAGADTGTPTVVGTPQPNDQPEKKVTHTPRPTNVNKPPKNTPPGKPEDKPPKPPKPKDPDTKDDNNGKDKDKDKDKDK